MVLVFGTICLDRIRRVPRMPQPGGYVEVTSELLLLGGEAANTAWALQSWGLGCILAGNGLGTGEDADLIRNELRERRLDPFEGHILSQGVTPVCDIFVEEDGERTMIGQGFSAMERTVDPRLLPYERGQWFTAEPNMPDAAREALRLAHAHGMQTYAMDFVGDDEPLFAGSFWQSSTDWAGERGNVRANIDWVSAWTERYGCRAVLTDGSHGLVAGSPGYPVRHFPSFPAGTVVDATGSGDLFRAGMLLGLSRDWPIGDCLRFASACGSLACRSPGGSNVPAEAEVRALIASCPEVAEAYGEA